MEDLIYMLSDYTRWYRRQFIPNQRYKIFLKADEGRTCIYFSYDMAEEIDACMRKCRRNRNYDDCFTACYEDVFDAVEEFLCEQVDMFERLLRRKGVTEAEPDCSGGYSGSEGTARWVRLCVPR